VLFSLLLLLLLLSWRSIRRLVRFGTRKRYASNAGSRHLGIYMYGIAVGPGVLVLVVWVGIVFTSHLPIMKDIVKLNPELCLIQAPKTKLDRFQAAGRGDNPSTVPRNHSSLISLMMIDGARTQGDICAAKLIGLSPDGVHVVGNRDLVRSFMSSVPVKEKPQEYRSSASSHAVQF
jgi:hypothetical protein